MKVRRAIWELATSQIGCCSDILVTGFMMVTTLVTPAFLSASLTRSLILAVL